MKEIKLFEHNEKAYQKLVENLKTHQLASINHATGTGKSFILLKYLYDNKDKKILYLAPTYQIIDQLLFDHMNTLGISVSEFEQFDTKNYMSLIRSNIKKIVEEYDIIVLDEYHRCGAPMTFKTVTKLINEIKENYPDKKVIGTTATEIRYLDNERDMNKLLFDGNCASELTLCDAIIDGLLPAPKYVCIPHLILEDIKKLRKMILNNFLWENEYQLYMDKCDEFENRIQDLIEKHRPIDSNIELGENEYKKYIVFSSNIKNMHSADRDEMHQILKGYELNENEVHCWNKKRVNREQLEEFKNAKSGINLLYTINLLSEGFHLKDIDAIFMLRPTTSPIIYFQHLGRLLSYSAKDKDVYVYDLVNNMKNHRAIVNLYGDLFTKLNELIKTTTGEEQEKYKKIKDNIALIDYSEELYKEYYNLKNIVSNNRLLSKKLSSAVGILEGNIEVSNIEKEYAYSLICTKFDYVTYDVFLRIKNLNMFKSGIYTKTPEEFKKMLNGYETLNEYKNKCIDEIEDKIVKYLSTNNKIPSLLSIEEIDKDMSTLIAVNFKYLSTGLKNEIRLLINSDKELTEFDRLTYNKSYIIRDQEKFRKDFEYATLNNIYISNNVFNTYYNISNGVERVESVNFEFTSYFEELRLSCIKETKINGEYNTIKKFIDEYMKFISKKLYVPTYNVRDKKELELYSKFIIYKSSLRKYQFDIVLDEFMESVKANLDSYNAYMKKIINFYKFKNKLPNINSDIEEEKDMAEYYKEYTKDFTDKEKKTYIEKIIKKGFTITFDDLIVFIRNKNGILPSELKEEESNFYNFYKKINKEERTKLYKILEEYEEEYISIAIEYINFLKDNRRYPLLKGDNLIETELLCNYNAIKHLIPKEYKRLIDQTILKCNRLQLLKNTYAKTEELENKNPRKKI